MPKLTSTSSHLPISSQVSTTMTRTTTNENYKPPTTSLQNDIKHISPSSKSTTLKILTPTQPCDPSIIKIKHAAAPHALPELLPSQRSPTEEQILTQFDLNVIFGPYLGITRLQRWQRAIRLDLSPPQAVYKLLQPSSLVQLQTPTQSCKGSNQTKDEVLPDRVQSLPDNADNKAEKLLKIPWNGDGSLQDKAATPPSAPPTRVVEQILTQFDNDVRFGSFLAISRRQRWERASRLGLSPPLHVANILFETEDAASSVKTWSGSEGTSVAQGDLEAYEIPPPDLDQTPVPTEDALTLFDFDARFGPFLGITRLARWDRANRLGLSPPRTIRELLMECDRSDAHNGDTPLW